MIYRTPQLPALQTKKCTFGLSGCRVKPRRPHQTGPPGLHTTTHSKRAHLRVPALQTPPKFHEKTPKERQKERKWGRETEKKREILPPPPFGARPLAILAQGLRPVRHLSKFPPRTISIVSSVQFFEEDELSKAEHRLVALQQETKTVLVSTPVDPSRVPPDVEAEFKKMQESSHPSSRRSQHLGRGKLVSLRQNQIRARPMQQIFSARKWRSWRRKPGGQG